MAGQAVDPGELLARALTALHEVVRPGRFVRRAPLDVAILRVPGEPIRYAEAVAATYDDFAVGARWGNTWGTAWFRLRGTVPAGWADGLVALRFDSRRVDDSSPGGEALVYRDDAAVEGLSPLHPYAVLGRAGHRAGAAEAPVELYVEASSPAAVPGFDTTDWPLLGPEPDGPPRLELVRCELALLDDDAAQLAAELGVAADLLACAAAGRRRDDLSGALADALALLPARPPLRPLVVAAARAALDDVLARPADGDRTAVAIGHAHLDTAWLWPMREAARKAARTVSTAVALAADYPDYVFALSAAQHLAWLEDTHPELFARTVEAVRGGRVVAVGGMWVEPDANLPSGESLVRQLVVGQRWLREHVGVEAQECWLPDTFGFPASLPGILRAAGMRRMMTAKMCWNDTNRIPHDTLLWEGIDGSRVVVHLPPSNTYNGEARAGELLAGGPAQLYPFGYGDGGGGPTREMLEALRRLRDLDGAPRVVQAPPGVLFDAVERDELPVWSGELYLEKHRGCLTSQAAVKRGNRTGERLLHEAELWGALRPDASSSWPAPALESAWRLLLVNQFHDVLAGSAIRMVYDDTARDHAEVRDVAGRIRDDALARLAAGVDVRGLADPVCLFNPTSFARREVVTVAGRTFVAEVPACGYRTYDLASPPPAAPVVHLSDSAVSNEHLRVRWDGTGRLVSVEDLDAGREVLAAPGNVLQLFADRPRAWDAWDIDPGTYDVPPLEPVEPADVEVVEASPLRARIRFRRSFRDSCVDQTMTLTAGSRRIDFVTVVDWREAHTLLKVAFPVAVRAAEAAYEIQFGHVRRATQPTTSWDRAKFEVAAHRWVDLSDDGYGVALLNDCKYGHDVRDNVLRLTLLRSPRAPDPTCDVGVHRFTYALLPHPGGLDSGVVAAGYALNHPLVAVVPAGVGRGPRSASYVSVDDPAVVVETVTRPYDGGGLLLRLYEAHGGPRRVRLRLGVPAREAVPTDLLERPVAGPLPVVDGAVELTLGRFELLTLVVR